MSRPRQVENFTGAQGSRAALDMLISLAENTFDGQSAYSLIENLRCLRAEDWHAVPPGGGRSIAGILEHAGWAKLMYEDYAFGSGTIPGNRPMQVDEGGQPTREPNEILAWLREGQERWLTSLRALADDSELERERMTGWGQPLPTKVIIRIVIAHDLYHAGEINHIRAVLQGNDRWGNW